MKRMLTVLAILVVSLTALARDNWDDVLDRYEQICNRCIELKNRMAAGENVSSSVVTELFEELGNLRNQLKNSSRSMTNAQKRRFEMIRSRYEGKVVTSAAPRQKHSRPNQPVTVSQAPPDTAVIVRIDRLPGLKSVQPSPVLLHNCEYSLAERTVVAEPAPDPLPWQIDAAAFVQFNAIPAPGIFISASRQQFGVFASICTNFRQDLSSYSILSDGSIEGGGYFWGNGQSRYSLTSIIAGPVWRPFRDIAVYAGAGYADYGLLWQDTAESWARVSDYGGKGLAGTAGMMVTLKRVNLLAGIWWQNEIAFTLGAGWRF